MSEKPDDKKQGNDKPKRPRNQKALALVLVLLLALVGVVICILLLPAEFITGSFDDNAKLVMDFKIWLLSTIVAAFSTWIGAGAAFFFGRQQYRAALDQMEKMDPLTPAKKAAHRPPIGEQGSAPREQIRQ